MKTALSKVVLVISCMVTLLTVAATCGWMYAAFVDISDADARLDAGLYLIAFTNLIAPVLGGLCLLSMILSGVFFFRGRQHRDLWSLCLSAGSLFSLIAEVAVVLCRR